MKGQAKTCKICGYKFQIGDLTTNHLIEYHINAFLNYWFFYGTPPKKIDSILREMLEYES